VVPVFEFIAEGLAIHFGDVGTGLDAHMKLGHGRLSKNDAGKE
jgi:hypothetical protein